MSLLASSCYGASGPDVAAAPVPTTPPPTPSPDHVRIAAAGDIACHGPGGPTPSLCQYEATSDLVVADDIDAVLMLGDAQYPNGRYEDFLRYYDPTWGRARSKTFPVPGDHAYQTTSGQPVGYYQYFGNQWRGPSGHGYYSFDLPEGCEPSDGLCWHLIALNSELCFLGEGCASPTREGSPAERQLQWLTEDLASHPGQGYPCTIAFFHDPMFHGPQVTEELRPLWDLLYAGGVDIVLNGDVHRYERWARMSPSGMPDPHFGIREFIVGTGGADQQTSNGGSSELVAMQDTAFGVLELGLYADEYVWRWVPAAGQPTDFTDISARPTACT